MREMWTLSSLERASSSGLGSGGLAPRMLFGARFAIAMEVKWVCMCVRSEVP